MTGIDVEDNAVVNNVVEILYKVVAPKTGRSSTLNGLTTPLHCTRPIFGAPPLDGVGRKGDGPKSGPPLEPRQPLQQPEHIGADAGEGGG